MYYPLSYMKASITTNNFIYEKIYSHYYPITSISIDR